MPEPFDALPAVFTLAVVPGPAARRERGGAWGAALLVLRRHTDGRITADGFPDEVDVCEPLVRRLPPSLQHVAWLDRGRLYVAVSNGEATYVPVGESPLPGCTRYGRIYLRTARTD
jgi:hypothetical protein